MVFLKDAIIETGILLHCPPSITYNCSMREKNEFVPPLAIAEAKIAFPSREEKEIAVEGKVLR
jgi:hypothetical protein